VVGDTLGQGDFGANDGEVNPILKSQLDQRLCIGGADGNIVADLSGAGITRSDIDFTNPGALGQLPDQGVLAGAAADN
jgi:hypothetical protein